MATFDEFYASLHPDIGIKGKQFEKFIKWFLKTDPTWASQIDEVWLWNEYPKRWGADCGIDLIFTHKNGNTWAVQSKCVSPNNDIKKSEIDSFLSESNDSKIDGRLLIASTDGIGKNAQQVINRQEKQVVCFLLEQFRQSEIEFPSSMEELNQGKRKEKKTPRPHQIEAIEKVSEALKTANRGQVLMACGTGKTLTSLWIKEKIKAKQVLVLVPSLSLLSQTLKEWNAEANQPFKWICVCSDKSVAKDKSEDQWISNTSEIGVPVTSETLEVKNFLDESGSKVVFTTYQSSQLIVEAQEHHDTSDFDLVIADEAHRCAGKVSDTFGSVLDEKKIKSSKRLFFTATPRILSKQIKTKSLDMDFEIASMDDHSVFGEVLYELKFSEAIKRDLLSDYQVVVIGVDDAMIKQKINNRELIKVDDETILDAEMIASQIAIMKAIKDYALKRVITFHSRIKNAKDFANSFEQVIPYVDKSDLPLGQIKCEHISGVMKTSERNQKLYELEYLKYDETRILTNARCLSEGVDVPTLSGIAFINPKQSQIDIIQAVGRAIRKSDDKSKGTVVIPLYISDKESLDDAILLSNFKNVWQIVIALKSQDDALMDCIDTLRIQKGSESKINFNRSELDKFIFDIPERITSRFPRSIKTLLVENSSEEWLEKFGQLKEYKIKNGHSNPSKRNSKFTNWITVQRRDYKKGNLSRARINLLDSINFSWNRFDDLWMQKFIDYKNFLLIKDMHIANRHPSFLNWVKDQRVFKKKNKLTEERINLLENINFSWDPEKDKWDENFKELQKFHLKNGHANPPHRSQLGGWVHRLKKSFQDGNLSKKQKNLLNSLNINWDIKTSPNWDSNIKDLKIFKLENGHTKVPESHPLHGWIVSVRSRCKKGGYSEERIQQLKSLDFIFDNREDFFNQKVQHLKKFKLEKGHANPPQSDKDLGKWVNRLRTDFKRGNLSKLQIDLLNELGFVFEPQKNFIHQKLQELKEYQIKYGNTKPSQSTPLGKWVHRKRMNYKNGNLSQENINLLENIQGWIWEDTN